MVERWWSDGGAMVERWWSDGGAMVERWWSDGEGTCSIQCCHTEHDVEVL